MTATALRNLFANPAEEMKALELRESVTRLTDGSLQAKIGTFYLGGSFPRIYTVIRHPAFADHVDAYNTGGSFHASSTAAEYLASCDRPGDPDDTERLRDHNAFAVALKAAVARLDASK